MPNRLSPQLVGYWLSRLIVGGAFIYAGILKAFDPLDYADSIAAYRLFPADVVNVLALGLPFFEIACGLLVVTGFGIRIGIAAIAVMLMAFMGAISVALTRGLKIDCGCFGSHSWFESNLWVALGRDAVLLLLAVFIYRYRVAKERENPPA